MSDQSIYEQGLLKVKTTPEPEGQKFLNGTFVKIKDNLGPTMGHFPAGLYAKVEYTYAHAYGGDNIESYSLLVRFSERMWSSVAWYHEWQLDEVIDTELLAKFAEEIKVATKQKETTWNS